MSESSDSKPAYHEISHERLSREGVVRERVAGVEILAVATAEGIRVYSGVCPHLGGPLLKAALREGVLTCPWHGYRFDVATARCLTAPGGPWRSLVSGCRESDEPVAISLIALRFESTETGIRVHLGGGARAAESIS
jgi:nitrite reductase/ring-hydroxylating ferredoxin subunit